MIIKVCGVTTPENARLVAASGVNWIGLNFWPASKRYVSPEQGHHISKAIREESDCKIVALTINAPREALDEIMFGVAPDIWQFHGDERWDDVPSDFETTVRSVTQESYHTVQDDLGYWSWVLIDSESAGRGGSGECANWPWAATLVQQGFCVMLAGGLTAQNVGEAIATVRPLGVDVASGVEVSPGQKCSERLSAFVTEVKNAEARLRDRGPGVSRG